MYHEYIYAVALLVFVTLYVTEIFKRKKQLERTERQIFHFLDYVAQKTKNDIEFKMDKKGIINGSVRKVKKRRNQKTGEFMKVLPRAYRIEKITEEEKVH